MNELAVSTRVAPWIGIGAEGHWASSAEALAAAQLDFTVRAEDLYWRKDTGDGWCIEEKAPMFATVRNTDDMLLGCVTPQYKIVQNHDAFSMLDPFLENGEITHAGMTGDGLVFMVAEVGMKSIGGEDYIVNLMATNSFNGKYPCQIIMTPIRIICQNMYRKLVNDRIFLAKHTPDANKRLAAIAQSDLVEKRMLTFASIIEQSQGKRLSETDLNMLIAMMFPYPKEGPRELAYRARTDETRQNFLDRYYDAEDNRVHQGTRFGFINAYYDWLSHRDAVRESTADTWADRRLSGLVSGLDVDHSVLVRAIG